jgi:ABC-type glycerol-3-phosphate transport system substrate-binding protein
MLKIRKTAMTAMLVLTLLAACGSDDPPGDLDSGTGDNVETTAGGGYN